MEAILYNIHTQRVHSPSQEGDHSTLYSAEGTYDHKSGRSFFFQPGIFSLLRTITDTENPGTPHLGIVAFDLDNKESNVMSVFNPAGYTEALAYTGCQWYP